MIKLYGDSGKGISQKTRKGLQEMVANFILENDTKDVLEKTDKINVLVLDYDTNEKGENVYLTVTIGVAVEHPDNKPKPKRSAKAKTETEEETFEITAR